MSRQFFDPLEPRRLLSAGELDLRFGGDGIVETGFGANTRSFSAGIDAQPDGKVVVAGYSTAHGGTIKVVRYRHDGSLDPSFADNGVQTLAGIGIPSHLASADVKIARDGKILVGVRDRLFRLTTTGAPDTSFGGGDGRVDIPFSSVEIDRAGRLLVNTGGGLTRLRPDGQVDPTFADNGSIDLTTALDLQCDGDVRLADVDVLNNGQIVLAGTLVRGPGYNLLVGRLGRNGQVDQSFGGGDGFELHEHGEGIAKSLEIQRDGKLLVAATHEDGYISYAFRCTSTGELDPTWGGHNSWDVPGMTSFHMLPIGAFLARSVHVQPDGNVLISGAADFDGDGGIGAFRFTPDGSFDTQFGGDGMSVLAPTGDYGYGGYSALTPLGLIVTGYGPFEPDSWFITGRFQLHGRRPASNEPELELPDRQTISDVVSI